MGIYVPFYNLAFINHLCTDVVAKIIGLVVTVFYTYVLWCLFFYVCKRTLCGKKNLEKIHQMEIDKLRSRLDYLDKKYGGGEMGYSRRTSRSTGNGAEQGYGGNKEEEEWPK